MKNYVITVIFCLIIVPLLRAQRNATAVLVAGYAVDRLEPQNSHHEVGSQQINEITKSEKKIGVTDANGILRLPLNSIAYTVRGTVRDENAEPLPGANVVEKGTTNGVNADAEGKFIINVSSPQAVLVVSFIGYVVKELDLNGRSVVAVSLAKNTQLLSEVVVTGYSRERKVDLTGAITVVDLAPVKGQSMSSGNAMQALQGRVPGLFIEKSGDPTGLNSRILIRGATTLGNNDPLYIIDGVPTKRQEVFASLNPEAIESVQVLKDASASSIYGSRAANGVIVVTTKQGAGERVSVTLNSSTSILSEKQQRYKMLNAVQRGEVIWRGSVNDGADPTRGYGTIYKFDWNGDFKKPVLNSVTPQPFVGGDPNVPVGDTDWQDAMYKTGYVFNNEVTISASSEKSSLLVNLGYLKNTGILKYTNYDRYTAKINGSTKLFNDKVRVGVNTQLSTSNQTLGSNDVGGTATTILAITSPPTIPVYDSNGEFAGPLGAGYSDRNNPLLMQYLNRWDNTNKVGFFGNLFAEWKILDNLTFQSSLGIDYSDTKDKDIEPIVRNGFVNRPNNRLIYATSRFTSLVFSNTLNYQLNLRQHRVGVLLGTESIKNDFNSLNSQANDFAVEQESYFVLDAATGARTASGSSTGSRLASQFTKLNYGFSDRYLASFTLRRDGSSRFGKNNRYGIFPAVSVGWRLNNEPFFRGIQAVSNLKFRAGYGEVGNQEIGDLARFGLYESRYGTTARQVIGGPLFNDYYNVGTSYDLNGSNSGNLPSGFVSVQAPNPNLRWETTKEWNYGIDFGFFKNAITGSFDLFSRKTVDILTTPPIASVIGEGQQRVLNGATTATKGWELSIGYTKAWQTGLTVGVSTNFGAFKDQITFLPPEVRTAFPGTAENSILGHSQFSIFGYQSNGLFQSQDDVASSPTQVGARPGGIKFLDLNGDNRIDANDRDFIGITLPALEYGVRLNLEYGSFDLSVFGSGVAGRIGLDPYIRWNNFVQGRENAGLGVLDAWTPENRNTDIPSLSLAFNDDRTSDYLYRNNSYFKIRNLQIGYSMPQKVLKRIGGVRGMRLYFQGENLIWFTPKNYIGSDPERTTVSRIPVPTMLSLGFNLNF